ncbi:MAG: DUF4982 domain-containing protein, partial [Calditrichaeota bacterium]|nr:DUF4982 domain-containing protein [Calditrichota bacterium]
VHILPHWNWAGKEGTKIPVFVYTNGDAAELFVNGKSQGIQYKNPKSKNSTERFRLMWKDVVYQPGELKAIAYKEGKVIGESTVQTAGKAHQLKLTADRNTINADGMDLSYILIEAIDKEGNLSPLADNKITIKLDGPGRIAGVGNGNPQSFNSFQSNQVNLFYGKAMLIIGSASQTGDVKINVTADNLKSDQILIQSKKQ